MALRALKTDEEAAAIPLDQPILIELPGGLADEPNEGKETKGKNTKTEKQDTIDPDAKSLRGQLEAAQAAQRASEEREARTTREANGRVAKAERDAETERKRRSSLEGDVITGGLAAAQSERDSAKAAFKTAFEAGDADAMANAQSRIGRSEAKILTFESGAAEIAERTEAEKHVVTERKEAPVQQSFAEAINANPNLMRTERDWMLKNEDAFKDQDFNKKLDFAYRGAMEKGLARGSQSYFDHIERATGLIEDNNDNDRSISVQAPPSRNERGSDGHVSGNKIQLTPDERATAAAMGVSETSYALGKQKLDKLRREDPERYANR